MDPGRRDKPITITRNAVAENDFARDEPQWETIGCMWAFVRPLVGRQLEFAREMVSTVSHEVMIDYPFVELHHNDRIVFDGRTLFIRAIVDPDERHHELRLYCDEVQP